MAIDVTAEITIDRSPADVAELMFDPKQDKLWVYRAYRRISDGIRAV